MNRPMLFLRKVKRQRIYLMNKGLSKKNAMLMLSILKKVDDYMNFYPKASAKSVKQWLKKHKAEIQELIPESKAGIALQNELTQILNS